jgi:hypothetical protein
METVTPLLKPDRESMLVHLAMLFSRAMTGRVEITAIKAGAGKDDRPRTRFFDVDDLDAAADWAVDVNSDHMWNVYVGAALRSPDVFPGKAATDEDFHRAWAIHADIDDVHDLPTVRRRYRELGATPPLVVVTGRTPKTRAQLWWPLDEPIKDADVYRRTLRAVAAHLRTDPQVTAAKQLMRLAGGVNWPKKDGRVLEKTEIIRPDGAQAAFSVEQLQRAFPPDAPGAEIATIGALLTPEHLSQRDRFAMTLQDGHWHEGALAFTASLIQRGVPAEDVLAMAPVFQRPGYTLEETEHALSVMIDGAVKKYGPPKSEPVQITEGAPLPILDPWERYVVPPFPLDVLPAFLRRYVEQQAHSIGACKSGIAMAALTAASAAISHDFRLKMLRTGDWHARPRLWSVLVGDPSDKKSPIVSAVTAPLHERDIKASTAYARAYAAWEEAVESKQASRRDQPAKPARHVVQDITAEKLSEILSRSDRGTLVQRDELAGWIGSMEQYKGGKGAGSADRAHWIKAYDGGRYTVDRVKGEIVLSNFSVSFLGAVQPDRLAELGNLTSDGLLQRFLPVMLGKPNLPQETETEATAEEYDRVLNYLASMTGARVLCSPDAHEVVRGFQAYIHELEQSGVFSKGMTGFLGKLPGVLGSLTLVLHLLEDPEGGKERPVDGRTARAARTILEDFCIPHAHELYRAADDKSDGETVRAIASYLLTAEGQRFRASDLTSGVHALRGTSLWDLQRKLSLLVAGGWIRPEDNTPNCRAWLLEDGVREAFAARAEQETARKAAARAKIAELGKARK